MKKRYLAVFLLGLMLLLAGCGKSKSPVVGKYDMTKISAMGMEFTTDEYLELMGEDDSDMTLEIKDNGKFSMKALGESGIGTWKYEDEVLTLSDGSDMIDGTYEDGVVTLTVDGVSLIFEK